MVAAMYAYWKAMDHKPDWALLANMMGAMGTVVTSTALQQRFEKSFRERVTKNDTVKAAVTSESNPDVRLHPN
jgi:hypothetical protein